MTRIAEVLLADDPARWLGIDVVADRYGVARVGTVALRFGVIVPTVDGDAPPPASAAPSPPQSSTSQPSQPVSPPQSSTSQPSPAVPPASAVPSSPQSSVSQPSSRPGSQPASPPASAVPSAPQRSSSSPTPRSLSGIVGWVLLDAPDPSQRAIDGLTVTHATDGPEPVEGEAPFLRIDHLIVTTPDLARTVGAMEVGLGEPCKRVRTLPTGSGALLHQAFFRLGEVIVEVVGPPDADPARASEPARFGGLVLVARDLDDLCRRLGPDLVNAPKAAVQQGRRIATVRAGAGLGCPVALMDDRRR